MRTLKVVRISFPNITMPTSQTLINGENSTFIDHADRGLAYGDGVFETLKVINNAPCYWLQHLERLVRGCKTLKFTTDFKTLDRNLHQDVSQLLESNDDTAGIIKIIVTRGAGPRGYGFDQSHQLTRICTLSSPKQHQQDFFTKGIRLYRCETTLAEQPILAGVKHLNRLEQVLARSEWGSEFEEGLMLTASGQVVEGVMSNVFMVKNNAVYTPLLNQAGVEGIMKSRVIAWAKQRGLTVEQRPISIDEFKQADHLWVCNSLIGVWPVAEFEGKLFPRFKLLDDFPYWLQQDQLASLSAFKNDV